MYIITLKFSTNKAKAADHMAAHKAWIQEGFDKNIFDLMGSLDQGQGGCLFSRHSDIAALDSFIQKDPFVAEGIVEAQIQGITPHRASPDFSFLTAE